jgi:hypothetical protein
MSDLTKLLKDAHLLRLDFKNQAGETVRNYGYAQPGIFFYKGPLITLHSKELFPEDVYGTENEIETARQNARESVKRQFECAYNNQTIGNEPFKEEYIDKAIEEMRGNASRPSPLMENAENLIAAVLEDANHPILLINSIRKDDLFFITDREHIADGRGIFEINPDIPLGLNEIVRMGDKPNALGEKIMGQLILYPEWDLNIYTTATEFPLFDWSDDLENPKANPKAIERLYLTMSHERNHGADFNRGEESYSALPEVRNAIDADTKTSVERFKVFMALAFLKGRAKDSKDDLLYSTEIARLNLPKYGCNYETYTMLMEMSVSDLTDYVIEHRESLYDTLKILGEKNPSVARALEDDVWSRYRAICNDALEAIAREETVYQQRGQEDKTQQTIHKEAVANFASMTQKYGLKKTAQLFPRMYSALYCETVFPRITNECKELCSELGYTYTVPFQPPPSYEHSFNAADRDVLCNLGAKDGGADVIANARRFYRDAIAKEYLIDVTGTVGAERVENDPFALVIDFGENAGAADLFCKAAAHNYITYTRDASSNKVTMTDYGVKHITLAVEEYHKGRSDRALNLWLKLVDIRDAKFDEMLDDAGKSFVMQRIDKAIDLVTQQLESLNLPDKDVTQLIEFKEYSSYITESGVCKLCERFLENAAIQGELRNTFEDMRSPFVVKNELYKAVDKLRDSFEQYERHSKTRNLGLREDPETKQIRPTKQSDLSPDDARCVDAYEYFKHLPNMTREVFNRVVSMVDGVPDLEKEVYPNGDNMKYVAEVLTSVVTARGVLLPEHQVLVTQQAFERC